jgi:hypothetical protein
LGWNGVERGRWGCEELLPGMAACQARYPPADAAQPDPAPPSTAPASHCRLLSRQHLFHFHTAASVTTQPSHFPGAPSPEQPPPPPPRQQQHMSVNQLAR